MSDEQMLAMLRHVYEQLCTPGALLDVDHKQFADGLIAPVIRSLEIRSLDSSSYVDRSALHGKLLGEIQKRRNETMARMVKPIRSSK